MPELGLGLSIQRTMGVKNISGGQVITSIEFHVQPGGAVAGVAFTQQPVVRMVDADGNPVTSFTGNITMSKESGTGTLSGTLVKAAVAGVATFTNLQFDTAGNFKLRATGNTGEVDIAVQSASFTVASATDADAQDFFDRVALAGGTISTAEKTVYNTFFLALKAAVTWSRIKELYVMAGDFAGSMVKMKYPSGQPSVCTNTGFTDANYDQIFGLRGDSTNYLDPGTTWASLGISGSGQSFGVWKSTGLYVGVAFDTGAGANGTVGYNGGFSEGMEIRSSNASTGKSIVQGYTFQTDPSLVISDGSGIFLFRFHDGSAICDANCVLKGYFLADEINDAEGRAINDAWEHMIGGLVSAARAKLFADSGVKRFVGFGDSISTIPDCGASDAAHSWVNQTAAGLSLTPVHAGISSSKFLDHDSQDDGFNSAQKRVASQLPTKVVNMYGINDVVEAVFASGDTSASYGSTYLLFWTRFALNVCGLQPSDLILTCPLYAPVIDANSTYLATHQNYATTIAPTASTFGVRYVDLLNEMLAQPNKDDLNPSLHPPDIGHAFIADLYLAKFAE